MSETQYTGLDHLKAGFQKQKKAIFITFGSAIIIAGLATGGIFAYAKVYDGKIYPNVVMNGVDVGGMTQGEAKEALQNAFLDMLNNGLDVTLNGKQAKIDLRNSGATDPDLIYDLMDFDADAAAQSAFNVARTGRLMRDQLYSVWLLAAPRQTNYDVTVLENQIVDLLYAAFGDKEEPGTAADFTIEVADEDLWEIGFVEATPGRVLDLDPELTDLKTDVLDLDLQTMELFIVVEDDMITEEEALALADEVIQAVEQAPYALTHTSSAQRDYEWSISQEDMIEWLRPVRGVAASPDMEASVTLGLDEELLQAFFDEIHEDVDVKAQNARFVIEDGRVEEFRGSLDGEALNEKETELVILEMFGTQEASETIVVSVVEPDITTGSVNNLGIEEILGVGVSDFSGSPANRRSNIQHGADKLNGLLIAPGETFSLVESLSPFTVADGWLPELVIKGDEIKPEVGGGACQFGTTLFRAVMNSGLEVTERRNHSLVVGYYNDPSNGNPGTDATIYDPAPDFKWTNDMENYVLLTTDVNFTTSEMVFTFWGTSDGRIGGYTPPQILSWNGYGPTEYKETTSLAPGVTRCQAPHSGATTSFDYQVSYADGTEFEKTFTSVYRSLPQVCLVGISEDGTEGGIVDPDEEIKVDNPPAEEGAEDELLVEDVTEETE